MRWPWQKRAPEPAEEAQAPEWGAWVLARKKGGGYERVFVERPAPPNPRKVERVLPLKPPVWADPDPLDIAPAFHMRYEQVYFHGIVRIKAIKQNLYTFKLQVREVYTDPKRVARRYWHRYMVKKRWDQIRADSNLFYGVR